MVIVLAWCLYVHTGSAPKSQQWPAQVGQNDRYATCTLSTLYFPGRSIDSFLDAGMPLLWTHNSKVKTTQRQLLTAGLRRIKQAIVRLCQIFVNFAGALLHSRNHQHKPWAQTSIRFHHVLGIVSCRASRHIEHAPSDLCKAQSIVQGQRGCH